MLNYLTNRFEEKRQAFDLLKSYNPWGKPGCGAPNPAAIRRHNLLVDGLFPEIKFKRSQFPETAILERRRNRSAVRTRHRDSNLYYHPNSKATVDNVLRWKTPIQEQIQYRKCLDDIITYKKRMEDEELKKNIEYEKKMLHSHGPWGARGPGGRPWRHPGNIGKDFFDSMGWTTETSFNFPPMNLSRNRDATKLHESNVRRGSNIEKLQPIESIAGRNYEIQSTEYNANKENQNYANRIPASSRSYMNKDENCRNKGCNCDVPTKPYRIPSGEKKRGGTPNAQLLELTGGIELVPLLRGRGKPPIFSGNRKWRARDSEYLKVLTEQIRMQQNKKVEHEAVVRFKESQSKDWNKRWNCVK